MSVPFETAASLLELPSVAHGFFGRRGGNSAGDFASLNTSESNGDDRQVVAANRSAIAGALGFATLATLTQTHSNRVVVVEAPHQASERPDADALVTTTPGILLGILTADCTPIAFADGEAGVIGIAHAGWKGAVTDIAGNTIAAMEALGARRSRIRAAIGPTISGVNYEVGAEFAANLAAADAAAARFIFTPAGGREHFDLPGFVRAQLEAAGIGSISFSGSCTYASPDRYFSHRYATHHSGKAGRQMSVIGLL